MYSGIIYWILAVVTIPCSATPFENRMLITVMERLTIETIERFMEVKSEISRDGPEKKILEAHEITGNLHGESENVAISIGRIEKYFDYLLGVIDDDSTTMEEKRNRMQSLPAVADSYVDSPFALIVDFPLDTPRLRSINNGLNRVLDGWYRWLIEYQFVFARSTSFSNPLFPEWITERTAIVASFSNLRRKFMSVLEELHQMKGEESAHLMSSNALVGKLVATRLALKIFTGNSSGRGCYLHLVEGDDFTKTLESAVELVDVLRLTIENMEFIRDALPETDSMGMTRLPVLRRIIGMNIREAKIVKAEFSKWVDEHSPGHRDKYIAELLGYTGISV